MYVCIIKIDRTQFVFIYQIDRILHSLCLSLQMLSEYIYTGKTHFQCAIKTGVSIKMVFIADVEITAENMSLIRNIEAFIVS